MQKNKKAGNRATDCGEEEVKREQEFSARSLLEEIEPLLKEYCYGEFCLEGDAITATFPNGQAFQITAK